MKKDDFFQRVYHVVRRIPYGRVTTYGLIAKFLGSSSSARTVGWALNASHSDSSIPAHRVVNRKGLLTGKQGQENLNALTEPREYITNISYMLRQLVSTGLITSDNPELSQQRFNQFLSYSNLLFGSEAIRDLWEMVPFEETLTEAHWNRLMQLCRANQVNAQIADTRLRAFINQTLISRYLCGRQN